VKLIRNSRASDEVDRIAGLIELDIVFGRLKPRERLVEDDLIARFETKRHVVRSALQELERLGILVRHKNRGASVRDFPPREVEELYDVRATLQRRAAEIIPLPAPRELTDALEALHLKHCRAVAAGDLRRVFELNNSFHDTLFSACGNRHLAEAIGHYAWLAHAIRSYRMGDPQLLEQARHEHGQMIEALRQGDRAALVRLCVEHINPSKEVYLGSCDIPPEAAPEAVAADYR
jgi:DNA-binding GntR family transcriptional regulator